MMPEQLCRGSVLDHACSRALISSDIQRPNLYRPLSEMTQAIQQRAQPLDKLTDFNDATDVDDALHNWPDAAAWVPLMARIKPMVVLLGENKSDVIAIVDLNPWH